VWHPIRSSASTACCVWEGLYHGGIKWQLSRGYRDSSESSNFGTLKNGNIADGLKATRDHTTVQSSTQVTNLVHTHKRSGLPGHAARSAERSTSHPLSGCHAQLLNVSKEARAQEPSTPPNASGPSKQAAGAGLHCRSRPNGPGSRPNRSQRVVGAKSPIQSTLTNDPDQGAKRRESAHAAGYGIRARNAGNACLMVGRCDSDRTPQVATPVITLDAPPGCDSLRRACGFYVAPKRLQLTATPLTSHRPSVSSSL
jgi:hypothetical protein